MIDVRLLLDQLDSDNVSTYLKARNILSEMDTAVMTSLVDVMLTRPDRLGWRVALSLAEMTDNALVPAFVQALHSPFSLIRQAAAQALGRFHDEGVIQTLLGALHDPDLIVQMRVVEGLGKLEARSAVEPLMALLSQTESTALQASIIQALGHLGDASVAARLAPFLDSPDRHVRSRALEVYAQHVPTGDEA